MLSSRWREPATFDLQEHVRCPSRIAAVVNRSTIFYSLIDKNRRPEKQQPVVESEHVTGHALYVRVERTEQANGLVEQLAALEGTAVITAADEPPAWLDERRRKLVLTPGEAKGLEYQRVCVLDVGAAIEAFDGNVLDDRTPLRQESRRTAIDQLRVALSRATETLAVVNVEPDPREDLSTLALVGGAGRYNQDDIIARFGDETATPEERTSERIRRAEASRPGPADVSLRGHVGQGPRGGALPRKRSDFRGWSAAPAGGPRTFIQASNAPWSVPRGNPANMDRRPPRRFHAQIRA